VMSARQSSKSKWIKWVLIPAGIVALAGASAYGLAYLYRDEILHAVNDHLSQSVEGQVYIGRVSFNWFERFPAMSVQLNDVYLRGAVDQHLGTQLLTAGRISLHLDMGAFWRGELHVEAINVADARVLVFRTARGTTNLDLFKARTDTAGNAGASTFNPALDKISLTRLHFTFADSMHRKLIDFKTAGLKATLANTDSLLTLRLSGNLFFHGLQFNPAKGAYLRNTNTETAMKLIFDKRAKLLNLDSGMMRLPQSQLQVNGFFEMAAAGRFQLDIKSSALYWQEGVAVCTEAIARKLRTFDVAQPLPLRVQVRGSTAPGRHPAVDVYFQLHDQDVTAGTLRAQRVRATGWLTNHADSTKPYTDVNSLIKLDSVKATVKSVLFRARAVIENLSDPTLQLDANLSARLADLNSQVDTTRFRFISGSFRGAFRYNGKLSEYLDATATRYTGTLAGRSQIEDASVLWAARNFLFTGVAADVEFDEQRVHIRTAQAATGRSRIEVKGTITNYVPFFVQPSEKGYVKLWLNAPSLDLSPLFTPASRKPKTVKQKMEERQHMNALFDEVYQQLEIEVDVNVKELQNNRFKAKNVTGRLRLNEKQLTATKLKMDFAKGKFTASFTLANLAKRINPLTVKADIRHADVKDFFYAFRNFNQKLIRDTNLRGRVNLNTVLRARLDDNFNVVPRSLAGRVDMTIQKGELRDFAPLERMSHFLFKKRDFSHVAFAELVSHVDVAGNDITIRRMEIQSSVLSLFVEGKYSFANNTDLSIQVPLSNLKKRDKTYVPKNVGTDARVGPSVFLRARANEQGETEISYDMFKKFRKKD